MTKPQLGDLDELGGQRVEADRADRLELPVSGAGGALEIRLVGVREAVRVGAEGREDRVLLEREHRVAGTGRGEHAGDRLVPLRVRERVPSPRGDGDGDARAGGDVPQEGGARGRGRPDLEVRVPGA